MFDANGFEVETCGRCGGCGQHSYCTMYGTRCFKCGGRGRVFTKRGAEANRFYLAMFEVAVETIKAGDWVSLLVGVSRSHSKHKVLEIVGGIQEGVSNGTAYKLPTVTLVVDTKQGQLHSTSFVGSTVRKLEPGAVMAERLVEAMEYQATLTKSGKSAKRKKQVA